MPPFLLAALSLVQLIVGSNTLSKNGGAQPPAWSDAVTALIAALENGSFEKPDHIDAIIKDLLSAVDLGQIVLPPDVAVRLDSIQTLLTKSQASIKNLESGQVAQVTTVTMSFNGKSVPVDVFAIRQDSTINVAVDLGLASPAVPPAV
jgi:hypothetical protein